MNVFLVKRLWLETAIISQVQKCHDIDYFYDTVDELILVCKAVEFNYIYARPHVLASKK